MKAKRRKTGWHPFLLFLAAGMVLIGCGDKVVPGKAQVQRQAVSGVSAVSLPPILIEEYYESAGTVKAANVSSVASRTMGTVTSLLVKEGDRVQKGQLLLTIDDRDAAQRVKAAEAGVQEAARGLDAAKQSRELTDVTYDRYKKMYEEKAISRQEMDQFATQKRVASLEVDRVLEAGNRAAAGLSEAKVYLGFAEVASPVQGIVTEKKTEIGSMAVPGVPLLTIEHTADFNAEITIDEAKLGKIRVGTPVAVSIEAINRRIAGKITEILPAVDPLSRTFTAKVSISGAGLRSGLYAKVKIPQGKKEVILVPRTAVVEKGQLTGVYTVDSRGIILYRLVRTGKKYGDNLEVLSGLKPNDRIIAKGVERAVDGGILENGKN